ncbi:MAG: hypothetical protein B6D37_08330 [Sphingobacteriales bacterium UTBCD1]|jgi:hypothetical protein|nr:MAG: hypothetical protein B6D37_08330 [Sphingobacteriales bacterium UTBCD1]
MSAEFYLKFQRICVNGITAVLFYLLYSVPAVSQRHISPDSVFKNITISGDTAILSERMQEPVVQDSLLSGVTEVLSNEFVSKRLFENKEIRVRHLPDSVVGKMQKDEDFWYANTVFKMKKDKSVTSNQSREIPLSERSWFQSLLWVLIIGSFLSFIMIYLLNSEILFFRRKPKPIAGTSDETADSGDIFSIDYAKEIDKATGKENYRLAVRLMFLHLLKKLSDKKYIQYAQNKTNFEYLLQMRSSELYMDFTGVTRNYEYVWYGKFAIDREIFTGIKNDFEKIGKKLR